MFILQDSLRCTSFKLCTCLTGLDCAHYADVLALFGPVGSQFVTLFYRQFVYLGMIWLDSSLVANGATLQSYYCIMAAYTIFFLTFISAYFESIYMTPQNNIPRNCVELC